jgi:hypothetical protein
VPVAVADEHVVRDRAEVQAAARAGARHDALGARADAPDAGADRPVNVELLLRDLEPADHLAVDRHDAEEVEPGLDLKVDRPGRADDHLAAAQLLAEDVDAAAELQRPRVALELVRVEEIAVDGDGRLPADREDVDADVTLELERRRVDAQADADAVEVHARRDRHARAEVVDEAPELRELLVGHAAEERELGLGRGRQLEDRVAVPAVGVHVVVALQERGAAE